MRMDDLKVGEEYAVKWRGYQQTRAKMLDIVTEVERSPFGGGRIVATHRKVKFEVVSVNDYGDQAGAIFLGYGRDVTGTWQEHVDRIAAREAAEKDQAEREALCAAAIKRLAKLINRAIKPSPGVSNIWGDRFGGDGIALDITWRTPQVELTMSAERCNEICDLLDAHGVGSAKKSA